MKKRNAFPFLTIILMSAMTLVHAQQSNQSLNSKLIDEYKTLISEKMQIKNIVGVGAALILGDSVWKEGFGYADKENKVSFTTSTSMAIGSITKVFTAMGVMQLQEKKLLNINEPLIEYLPQFKVQTRGISIKEITVKSLIQHTSGLPRDFILNIWNSDENYTNTVDYIKSKYLAFPPNMVFHYSNVGYTLLGHTIFNVSKQDYPAFIKKNILEPSDMNNSGFLNYSPLKNISKTYDTAGIYMPLKTGNDLPAGALFSTVDDMVKFAREIISIYHGKNNGFIKPETLKLIERSHSNNIENINTCLGWDVFKNDSCLIISHFGSYHLTNAAIAIDLKRKNAIIFFANTVGGMELVADAFAKFQEISGVTAADYVQQQLQKDTKIEKKSIVKQYANAGMYVNTNEIHTVSIENKQLVLKSSYGDFRLSPVSNNEFIPGIILTRDSIRWLTKSRFIFTNVRGYHLLFWQDANNKRQLLGQQVIPRKVNKIWIKRLGTYKLDGFKLEGWEQYSKFELSLTNNHLLMLKVFCTTGEYFYYLRLINVNELVICGFGELGGETLDFSKDGKYDRMKFMGLPLKKILNK